ncbi:MAG: GrdX family protein [Synergistaceae bacterium]|nr:GrdX family protein [Synergistaceae bacterium]
MSCRRLLITNNPLLSKNISCSLPVEGTSLDVLRLSRDHVHGGWAVLSSPLYGNLRPHQHPYRSVLIEKSESQPGGVDLLSLELIENALLIYTSQEFSILSPEGMPEEVREDFACIDAELMKETLERYRLFPRQGVEKRCL